MNRNCALRSYRDLPRTLIYKEQPEATVLLEKEWSFLRQCDGEKPLCLDEETKVWLHASRVAAMIHEAAEGETLSAWQKNIEHDNRYFPAIEWRITDRCNYNCLHCYNASDESACADQWEYEEALAFLDQCRECGILEIRLSGGEPMLHKRFPDLVRAIYERGMYVGEIVTNGSFLNRDILSEIASYGKKPLFKVSFDGFGFHDWMRNYPGAEKQALKAFELLAEEGFPILVNSQINRRNKDSFSQTISYFDALGIQTLRFIRTTEVPRWVLNAGDASLSYEEYYDVMLDVLREYHSKPRKMALTLWAFGIFRPEGKSYRMVHTACPHESYRDTMPACPTVRKQICVGAGGNIYPCSQQSGILDSRNICLGNVKRDGLQKLLQDSAYTDIACMTVADVRERNPKCAVCTHFEQCHGGCRGLGFLTTGDLYGEDGAMCKLFELDYESKVQEIMSDWSNAAPSPGHDSAARNENC